MREELKKRLGVRGRWTATFVRFGTKAGFQGRPPIPTLLVRDVKDAIGHVCADHLWVNLTKEFEALALENGVEVSFEARVEEYEKGYRGPRDLPDAPPPAVDYHLARPNNVRLVKAPSISDWKPDAPGAMPSEQGSLF